MTDRDTQAPYDRPDWGRGISLTTRILAVNVIALGLMAGSLFYLDSYRRQLLAERFILARAEAEIAADALARSGRRQRLEMLAEIGADRALRLRLYDARGRLVADSFQLAEPSYTFADPAAEPWYQNAARALDAGMDFILGAPPIPDYVDPEEPGASAWPEIADAVTNRVTVIRQRLAPDRTPVITAAVPVGNRGEVLLTTRNASDITQSVRNARQTLAVIVGTALAISILLSLFLARTIVSPLRTLVRAAVRVRLGREREVVVPRLPQRRDEIGLLARAVSDMTAALRQRIDAVEAFAADVAHELKNPLTSLRSALESLERVDDPDLRRQLSAIAMHDVKRIDRLVTEISDASRIDAELSRTAFEPVDVARLIDAVIDARDERDVNRGSPIIVTRQPDIDTVISGDADRLERVFENLFDNAVSFSPRGAAIEVDVQRMPQKVVVAISDHGPGIPADARNKVFERFHSLRPANEDFGSHSGLGLAIARTIAEAHDGTLTANDRRDGKPGTQMLIELPTQDSA